MKILWAVDAFDDLTVVEQNILETLKGFSHRTKIEVQPVYVLSPDQLGLAWELAPPWAELYAPSAKKVLNTKFKDWKTEGWIAEPEVLTQLRPSLKGTVQALAAHAASKNFDMIVAGTHGRKGFQRLALGSFAESLLQQSSVPVLVVSANTKVMNGANSRVPNRILVPSDLSDPKSKFFEDVFEICKAMKSKMTLLHAVARPLDPVFQSGVYLLSGAWVPGLNYFEQEQSRQNEAAKRVVDFAQEKGMNPADMEVVIDSHCVGAVDSILKYAAENQVTMIAMAAESGPLAAVLIGSITRQVVRQARCPVLVYRAKAE